MSSQLERLTELSKQIEKAKNNLSFTEGLITSTKEELQKEFGITPQQIDGTEKTLSSKLLSLTEQLEQGLQEIEENYGWNN